MTLKNKVMGLFLTLGLTQGYGCNDEKPVKLEYGVNDAVQSVIVGYDKRCLDDKAYKLFLVSGLKYTVDEDESAIVLFSKQLKISSNPAGERYDDNKRVLFNSGYLGLLKAIAPIMDFNSDGHISEEELGDPKLINQAKVKKYMVYQK